MVEEKVKPMSKLDEELSSLYQQKPGAKIVAKVLKPKLKKKTAATKKTVLSKGHRKEAIARAVLKAGTGKITINGVDINFLKPQELRELILEPTKISSIAEQIAKSSDIEINVRGGGVSGQAQASRTAIAKALTMATGGESLRGAFMSMDRSFLVDDSRHVEPKKFLGTKARARFQKSYR
jgi:small subunit ribosomal protein S9